MRIFFTLLILNSGTCFSQILRDSVKSNFPDAGLTLIPNMHSTHPLGVFISETNHSHQLTAVTKYSLAVNMSCGNVWLPYVKGYMPLNEADKSAMEKIVWHGRESNIELSKTPARTKSFQADGDIRFYQINLTVPVSKTSDLKINTRAFSLQRGLNPLTFLTSDKFIEWFHSNIAGGEDPFARRVYGYNQAKIVYTDPEGKSFSLENGDFRFTGIDLSYTRYPIKSLAVRNMSFNYGLQVGVNTTKINPSIDFGLTSSINKLFMIGSKRKLDLNVSGGILRQKALNLGEGVDIISSKYLYTAEILLNYQKKLGEKSFIGVGTSYYIHSAYNKKEDFKTIILTGERISTHWHYALSHLYRTLTYNTIFMSYTVGRYSFSLYVKEDLLVDNAPDVQTGVGFGVSF